MSVAPTVAMGQLADGSISILACSISNYLCTNFDAFIKKYTIDQLIRSTISGFVALRRDAILYVTKVALLGSVKVVFKLFTSHLDNL